jgi:phosphate transport system permease protein
MHLGFHIYDVGFQSPNIEAAMTMVYSTTLLLIFIVILLNITAMIIRANLRKKYKTSAF